MGTISVIPTRYAKEFFSGGFQFTETLRESIQNLLETRQRLHVELKNTRDEMLEMLGRASYAKQSDVERYRALNEYENQLYKEIMEMTERISMLPAKAIRDYKLVLEITKGIAQ